ncbi:exodeoxyribonuclease VII small subunit [Flexivirga oryzae]|uniref:Exodeoxyribonuclease 7 small subunit n=1 Tax=Flexivirga oryzae TaxID=1794944 RepID=A0A839NJ16_9MICO|nr:exodeoxyribonuclease VII small subunit [Flexivirga oryzae]MBB2894362.1 exodeoxyribonuclease VII small subunit [Flexivirga oryzae]
MPKKDAPDDATTNADVAELGYEEARDELAAIVARLESGTETLEESMRLWERGETLAAHCERWLDGAQQKIDAMTAGAADGD